MPTWAQRLIVIVAEAIVGLIATVSIKAGVSDPNIRNWAIPIIWGVVVVSAVFVVWRLVPEPSRRFPNQAPKRKPLRKAVKEVSGETNTTDASQPDYMLMPASTSM